MKTGKIKVECRTTRKGIEKAGLIVSLPTQSFVVNDVTANVTDGRVSLTFKGVKPDEVLVLPIELKEGKA